MQKGMDKVVVVDKPVAVDNNTKEVAVIEEGVAVAVLVAVRE